MANDPAAASDDLRHAFNEYERNIKIQNYKVGCVLGIVFMPAGASLDFFVYPEKTGYFFALRLLSSLLLWGLYWLFRTPFGIKNHKWLGIVEVSVPLFFISWMIAATEGAASPYYAGLNLVLMGSGLVLRWTLLDSIMVFLIATTMFFTACFVQAPPSEWAMNVFYNNIYFMLVTGAFIITGNYFFDKLRYQEFVLRFELDQNRAMLEESNRKLVELDQIKSQFFANISHELRTPLTLLLAPIESMINQKRDAMDEESYGWLQTMQANGLRLLKLINDLLDLVRLESGRMQVKREVVQLDEFVNGLTASIRKLAQDRRLHLETAVAKNISAVVLDRDKLEKILLNLTFNAIKFTPAGGKITLRVEKENDDLLFRVQDTGIGIAEKNLPHVFDRFWQADATSQKKQYGVGIGLALVKELAEVQGGRAEVTSEIGKGTTMSVRLPYLLPEQAQIETQPEEKVMASKPDLEITSGKSDEWLTQLYRRAELFTPLSTLQAPAQEQDNISFGKRHGARILVADDEPEMLRFLTSTLRKHFDVIEAVDGQQAIDKAAQYLPDLMLVDMMMPEKDGLEVCRELRAKVSTQNIPIVLLTARADEETKMATLSAGASDFLTKPFSTTELHVRLKNLLESHELQKKLAKQNQILEATIQQLKETEAELVQSEKMASLGRMSAGIIHEINNPLNYAKMGLYSVKNIGKNLTDEQQRTKFGKTLTDIEDGINRVSMIVSDLRTFTHPNPTQLADVAVSKIIETALRFLSHEWSNQVDIIQQIPPELTVQANYHKIIQVAVNLIQNSLTAQKKKKFGPEEKPTIWITGEETADKILIKIKDNGEGIGAEHIDKIFDPFFTTRDVGEGMGLGLSICYRIMQEHHGKISVQSQWGKYCEFTLEFPKQKVA